MSHLFIVFYVNTIKRMSNVTSDFDMLKLICSDQHQVFGRMSGTAVLDDGTKVVLKDFLCFAEKVHNKY